MSMMVYVVVCNILNLERFMILIFYHCCSAGGMALSTLVPTTVSSISLLAKSAIHGLQMWSLHGLLLTIEAAGLSFVSHVQVIKFMNFGFCETPKIRYCGSLFRASYSYLASSTIANLF